MEGGGIILWVGKISHQFNPSRQWRPNFIAILHCGGPVRTLGVKSQRDTVHRTHVLHAPLDPMIYLQMWQMRYLHPECQHHLPRRRRLQPPLKKSVGSGGTTCHNQSLFAANEQRATPDCVTYPGAERAARCRKSSGYSRPCQWNRFTQVVYIRIRDC